MSEPRGPNLLETQNGRRFLFTALYVSEGAPIGYIWWALPAMLRDAGWPIDRITHLTATITLVWAFKFLWAPLVDSVRSPRWGIRHWIVLTQACMGLALIALVFVPRDQHLGLLTVVLFVHALFASTQDASVDALCIVSAPHHERGGINAWMQIGLLLGRALFGGVALAVAGWIGQTAVILLMLAVIWSTTLLVVFLTREPARAAMSTSATPWRPRRVLQHLKRAFSTPAAFVALGFALTGGAAFEAAGAVAGPMLIDCGWSSQRVGGFFALPVLAAIGLGALAGGYLSDRIGHLRAAIGLTTAMGVTVLALAGAHMGRSMLGVWPIVGLLAAMYLLFGAFSASSYAMFMDRTDPSLGATQFSAFMGATNLCESWSTYGVGLLIARLGYGPAFAVFAGISLLSIGFVLCLRSMPPPADDSGARGFELEPL